MKLIFINIIFVLYTFCTLFLQTGCYLSDNAASIIGRMKSIRTLNYSECQRIMDWEKSNKHLNPELISVNFSIIKSVDNTGIKETGFTSLLYLRKKFVLILSKKYKDCVIDYSLAARLLLPHWYTPSWGCLSLIHNFGGNILNFCIFMKAPNCRIAEQTI